PRTTPPLFPYTTLFRSSAAHRAFGPPLLCQASSIDEPASRNLWENVFQTGIPSHGCLYEGVISDLILCSQFIPQCGKLLLRVPGDRKRTRLNSSHQITC